MFGGILQKIHSLLTGIRTRKDITGRLTNMILKLQEYNYELIYLPGKKNVVADAMTRGPIADKREKGEGVITAIREVEDTPEKWEERRKERKLIMKERLIGALAGEVDIEEI